MKIEIIPFGDDPLVFTRTGEDRPEGLHLSDILRRRMFERDKKFNPENPLDAMRIEAGFAWERMVELAWDSRQKRTGDDPGYRPDPIQMDGVWCSPDWDVPAATRFEEWKATKASMRHPFEQKHWYWMDQILAYARALKRRECWLRVWYINGDYSYESKVDDLNLLKDIKTYRLTFDAREIEEKWRGILSDGVRYGLLKGQPSWEQPRSPTRKSSPSKVRATSSGRAKIITFRTTRKKRD